MTKETCSICCTVRPKVLTCLHCSEKMCNGCVRKFLFDEAFDICMYCKKEWNADFLQKHFTKSYLNLFRRRRKADLFFEFEKAKMPDTQKFVLAQIELESKLDEKATSSRIKAQEIDRQNKSEKERLLKEYTGALLKGQLFLERHTFEKSLLDNIRSEQELVKANEDYRKYVGNHYKSYKQELNKWIKGLRETEPVHEVSGSKVSSFILKCRVPECKGYIDSSTFTCAMCTFKVCRMCYETRHTGTECNPDTVATVNLIKKDSKTCPKCFVPIHKIIGCSQMFCTSCNVVFNWDTLKIHDKGRIHNPHYVEYIREKTGRINEHCVFIGNNDEFVARYSGCEGSILITMRMIYRSISHLQQHDFLRYYRHSDAHRLARIAYMRGKLTEDQFKRRINQTEKKNLIADQVYSICQMFVGVTDDILGDFYEGESSGEQKGKFLELLTYTNICFQEISKKNQLSYTHTFILPRDYSYGRITMHWKRTTASQSIT